MYKIAQDEVADKESLGWKESVIEQRKQVECVPAWIRFLMQFIN